MTSTQARPGAGCVLLAGRGHTQGLLASTTLKVKFSEALYPEDTLGVLMSQLETRKRQSGEALQDLRVKIYKLVSRVYPGLEPLYLERHSKEAFLKSIAGTSYGEKAIDAQPKTLDDGVFKAVFFEQREHVRTTC